jgi:hypothetical protein
VKAEVVVDLNIPPLLTVVFKALIFVPPISRVPFIFMELHCAVRVDVLEIFPLTINVAP